MQTINIHCECAEPGFCPRHQVNKSDHYFSCCRGTSGTSDCGLKHWLAWEQGRLGATAPENPILELDWPCKPVRLSDAAEHTRPKAKAKRSNVRRALSYAESVIRWKAAGSPVRSDAETARIYEDVCTPCEHFTGTGCQLCGCRLSKDAVAMHNKIRMQTESCPIGKWEV